MDHLNLSQQELLQQSEIRYRRLFEAARDGILLINPLSRKITDVNPFMTELLGFTREHFIGKELWEIGLLKDEVASIKAFNELQENNYIRYDDLPLKTKSGESRDVEFVSNVYIENNNSIIQCNIRDITERIRNEKLLKKAESNYRNLIESTPGIIYLIEPTPPYSTIFISQNIKLYGYSPEEWIALPAMWLSIVHKDDYDRVFSQYETAWEQDTETELEYRITARNGTIHWWHDKGRFVKDESGNKTGWQGIILDITNTKKLEEQLRHSKKLEAIGLLTGGIAHDFNNMLTAINGYSDLTLRRIKDSDPITSSFVEQIANAGKRSAALTYQLLAFSRQQVLKPIVVDLNEIITDTTQMLNRLIGEDIQLTTLLNSKSEYVKVDPGQFSQIIMNLAINARDAMPQGGKLTIEIKNVMLDSIYSQAHLDVLPGPYVMLAISDTGTGMSDDTKKHIFEPFFTTKEVGKGTGLGLSTVYGIVKQSGGNIEVYSEEGIGTTFMMYFPQVEVQSNKSTIPDKDYQMSAGTETILLVEDEAIVRNLAKEILIECGYTVLVAENGIEALEISDESSDINLLLTDVVMPKMGGRELAEQLKLKFPNIQIVFTSGYTDDAVVRHGVIEANTNFIQKPYTPQSLADTIRQVLDNA